MKRYEKKRHYVLKVKLPKFIDGFEICSELDGEFADKHNKNITTFKYGWEKSNFIAENLYLRTSPNYADLKTLTPFIETAKVFSDEENEYYDENFFEKVYFNTYQLVETEDICELDYISSLRNEIKNCDSFFLSEDAVKLINTSSDSSSDFYIHICPKCNNFQERTEEYIGDYFECEKCGEKFFEKRLKERGSDNNEN